MTNIELSQIEKFPDNPIVTDKIKSDFRNFLFVVWKFLKLPPPTPVQYEIAYYLQHGPKRQIIEAFRGVGKNWITSFVLWRLYCDPQQKFLVVVSASKQRADDFSTFTLRLINDMPILQHLKPKDDQRNSKIAFDVSEALPAHALSAPENLPQKSEVLSDSALVEVSPIGIRNRLDQ